MAAADGGPPGAPAEEAVPGMSSIAPGGWLTFASYLAAGFGLFFLASLALGLLFVIHASPMATLAGTRFQVFASAHANAVAAPIFLGLGGMMLLVGLYYAWREWSCLRPPPGRHRGALA